MAAGELAPREARRDSGMPSTSQQQPDQTGLPQAHQLVGTRVLCHTLFDGRQHVAEVLQYRSTASRGQPEYYVHYPEFDKRLDEWVSRDRLSSLLQSVLSFDGGSPRGLSSLPSLASDGVATLRDLAIGEQHKLTRRQKRHFNELHHVPQDVSDLAPMDQHLEKEHQEKTKVKNIQIIELGRFEIDTWYYSPYPEPFASQQKLFLCEFCLKYFRKRKTLLRHLARCDPLHPPGDEIYRAPAPGQNERNPELSLSVFEVDGKKNKVYCQSLCLLSKLFLDHKTLYYDVDPFLFYILCEHDKDGHHIVGYFSKEKYSSEGYNLACILSLPPYQRNGYGKFLIAFSYELSKKEIKVGTPERPLSDLGQVSYRSYWTRQILHTLRTHGHHLSIKDIAEVTSIRTDDIVTSLQSLNLIKYWKGDHIIAVTSRIVDEHMRLIDDSKFIDVDATRLHWEPHVQKSEAPLRR